MNTNEEILDLLLKRDLLLQRVSNGLSKEIASQYIKMIDEAINSLGRVDISLINMNKIIKEINSNIGLDYASVEDNFNEVAITEASFIPKAINGIVAVDIINKTLPDSLVNKIVKNSILSDGYTIKEGFEKLDTRLQETFQNQIRLGVLNGDTTQTIIKNLKPYMTDFKDNRIEALVKTAVSTVVNNTRMETYKENEEIFKGYQHQSVLDSRTTFICAERDNKEWDLELKPIGHKLPFKQVPIHYMCRSIILPLTKSYRELGLDIDEIPIGTRSSLNGYVPANTSFSQWFDKQSADFKENYLGKGRYQLYKDGKITLSDLVNQKGQTLSLKELKGVSNVPVKATVPKIDNSINTINSESIDKATFRLSRYADAVSKNLKSYDIDFIDGTYAGLNEVLGNYKTAGKVTTIGITNKAGAQFIPSTKWQPESHFKVGDFMSNYKSETTLSQTTIERWQERINKNIQVNTTGNYANSKFEYAKILMSHEAWHKVDGDNKLTDIFMQNLYSKGIIKDKLDDYSYKISYYAGKAGNDELFAEVGALYSNNRRHLIPKEMLQAFEETIERVKK